MMEILRRNQDLKIVVNLLFAITVLPLLCILSLSPSYARMLKLGSFREEICTALHM